jgi:hypothetical protein
VISCFSKDWAARHEAGTLSAFPMIGRLVPLG